jgi:uncharacterized membrane protein YphA (DoxX/SURF4 family)
MLWKKGELLKATGLYLLIIPFLNALNATGYEGSQIQGHFGASSVEFMYINLIPIFVMLAGLPLALELSKKLPLKSMMLVYIMSFSAFLLHHFWNCGCSYSNCSALQSKIEYGDNVWHCSISHTRQQ